MLGYRVLNLSSGVEMRDAQLRTLARPFMVRIRKICRETTNLTVLVGRDIVYIEQLPGLRALRMFAEPGRKIPAHATASGKAILASMRADDVDELLGEQPFERFTPSTVVDLECLHAELETVRRNGFAVDREEYEDAVTCIAAPILDSFHNPIAALSVSGPSSRLGMQQTVADVGELIHDSAADAFRQLERRDHIGAISA